MLQMTRSPSADVPFWDNPTVDFGTKKSRDLSGNSSNKVENSNKVYGYSLLEK